MSLALQSLPFLWQGLLVTLHVSALVVLLSLAAGLVLGVALATAPAGSTGRSGCTATSCAASRSWS